MTEFLGGFLVAAVLQQLAGDGEVGLAIVLFVTYHVAIGGDGFLRGVDALIAICHLAGYLSAPGTLFRWRLRIGPFKFVAGIVILSQGEIFLTSFEIAVGTARTDEGDHGHQHHHEICLFFFSNHIIPQLIFLFSLCLAPCSLLLAPCSLPLAPNNNELILALLYHPHQPPLEPPPS